MIPMLAIERTLRTAWGFCATGLLVAGCAPTAHLDPYPVADLESSLLAPTGSLEETDALGLAYAILGTEVAIQAALVSASELPGVRRSPEFVAVEIRNCGKRDAARMVVSYPCLGWPQGELAIASTTLTPNENGDYDLELLQIDLGAGAMIDGSATLRVEGVANPTTTERALLAPIAVLDGFPERFDHLSRVGVRIDLTRGSEKVESLAEILGQTYAFRFDEKSGPSVVNYTVRDARNVWTCRTEVDGQRILRSECKTPVGHGDYAVLRF
jgi:hypothetical protein